MMMSAEGPSVRGLGFGGELALGVDGGMTTGALRGGWLGGGPTTGDPVGRLGLAGLGTPLEWGIPALMGGSPCGMGGGAAVWGAGGLALECSSYGGNVVRPGTGFICSMSSMACMGSGGGLGASHCVTISTPAGEKQQANKCTVGVKQACTHRHYALLPH
jgi:hypothetical protein